MPQNMNFAGASNIANGGTAFFDLKGPTSAEIDMRLGVMMIGPTFSPFLLLGQKGEVQFGGQNYGSAPVPIGVSFGTIEGLKGPKHTWQEQTLLRNVNALGAAATIGATAMTFSITQNAGVTETPPRNVDAYQISTYDVLETVGGELIYVTAMDYATGIATVVRGFAGTTAAALASGDRVMRVSRLWPEGSEIDFRKDVNVNNRMQDYNLSGIVRTPMYMTRTAKDSLYLATPEDQRMMKSTAMEHVRNLESSLLLSVRFEGTNGAGAANAGLTMRTGDGILPKMDRDRPGQVVNLVTTPTALGTAIAGGSLANMTRLNFEQFLSDYVFKAITHSQMKYLFCSTMAIKAIHNFYPVGAFDRIERDPIGDFGQVVTGLETPYGTVKILPYQLLTDRASRSPAAANVQILAINGECFRTGYMKKTVLQKDIQNPSADGTGWAYLTEIMMELSALETHAVLKAAI